MSTQVYQPTRPRRPALIPFSAFNTIESPSDLSSILPQRHGGTYIIPPPPPPPDLHYEERRWTDEDTTTDEDEDEKQPTRVDWRKGHQQQQQQREWPVAKVPLKRWSYKDVIMEDECEEDEFETGEDYMRQNRDSGIHEDLFSWVNSTGEFELSSTNTPTVGTPPLQPRKETIESPPMSPMSGNTTDIQYQMHRLEEATRLLNSI